MYIIIGLICLSLLSIIYMYKSAENIDEDIDTDYNDENLF